jgi:GxxExxY protein
MTSQREFHPLSSQVIAAAIEVHRHLGPGLLESTYLQCLCHELALREIAFRKQVPIPVQYGGVVLDCGYRADLIVGEALLVELKAVETVERIHVAQTITYLKLGHYAAALLINFNVTSIRQGLRYLTPKNLPDLPDLPVNQ